MKDLNNYSSIYSSYSTVSFMRIMYDQIGHLLFAASPMDTVFLMMNLGRCENISVCALAYTHGMVYIDIYFLTFWIMNVNYIVCIIYT